MKADLIFILIVSITVFIGYRRGFIKSFLSLFYIIFSEYLTKNPAFMFIKQSSENSVVVLVSENNHSGVKEN